MHQQSIDASFDDTDLFSFEPKKDRGRRLDEIVRHGFAGSLERIVEVSSAYLDFDRASLEACIDAVRRQPALPAIFGMYSDLVEAIFDEDETQTLSLMAQLGADHWHQQAPIRTISLNSTYLGAGQPERYARIMNDNPDMAFEIQEVGNSAFHTAKQNIESGKTLIGSVMPEALEELDYLAREIVLAEPRTGEGPMFHGASNFYLWGAVILNGNILSSRLRTIETLVHESSHSLLLGLTSGAPLVTNTADDLYLSPLRPDARPMDGIVHAVYVLARMHYALSQIEASGLLEKDEKREAAELIVSAKQGYEEGIEVVDREASFTETGSAAFEGARRYMKAA